DDAPLGFATAPLPRFAHLALALDRRLLVITAPLDLLEDPLLGHLLLQDLQGLVDGIPDFDCKRPAEQCLQAVSSRKAAKSRKGGTEHLVMGNVKARQVCAECLVWPGCGVKKCVRTGEYLASKTLSVLYTTSAVEVFNSG